MPVDNRRRKRGAVRKYPWEVWLGSREAVTLVRGRDFHCSVRIMRQQAYNQAQLMGWRISTRCDGKRLSIMNLSKNGRPKT